MSKKFFNEKAVDWDSDTEHSSQIISDVISELPNYKNPNILDVGCGTGILFEFLQRKYSNSLHITAIDYAKKMIAKAKQKYSSYSNISYIVDDVYEHKFPDSFFDIVICYSVLPHLFNKKKIISKFYNLLKNGGFLLIFHSESREAINSLHKEIGGVVEHDYLPKAEKVEKMAKSAGFLVDLIYDSDIYLLKFRKDFQ